MEVSENIEDLEQEKDRFINEVDVICQQQQELEDLVLKMENEFKVVDYTKEIEIDKNNPATVTVTASDIQRQNMFVFLL